MLVRQNGHFRAVGAPLLRQVLRHSTCTTQTSLLQFFPRLSLCFRGSMVCVQMAQSPPTNPFRGARVPGTRRTGLSPAFSPHTGRRAAAAAAAAAAVIAATAAAVEESVSLAALTPPPPAAAATSPPAPAATPIPSPGSSAAIAVSCPLASRTAAKARLSHWGCIISSDISSIYACIRRSWSCLCCCCC